MESGVRYGDFSEEWHDQGFVLYNLASLPCITVAGGCVTATHRLGVTNGNLAMPVLAVELVIPSVEIVNLERSHPDFYAVVLDLGDLESSPK